MKSQDVIVTEPFAPNKPHSDLMILGYKFLCSHISVERFIEDDLELDTRSHYVVAVKTDNGVNFYCAATSP